jgi:anti-sigma factor RsiW
MNVNCTDRERIFEQGGAAEWAALEAHAETCAECGDEVRAWKAISVAAAEMRDYSPSSELWERIERGLRKQTQEAAERRGWRTWLKGWSTVPTIWQVAAASAMVLLLTISGVWISRSGIGKGGEADAHFLKNPALAEVERAESAYVKAIDKLAAETQPQLENPATPLLASYKEKLLVLDSAIDDLRMQAGLNPSNAHLRHELLAMYQQKQQTLQEVLEIKQ